MIVIILFLFLSDKSKKLFLLQFHPNDYKMIVLMIVWIMTSARVFPSIRPEIRSFAWNHSFIASHRFAFWRRCLQQRALRSKRWDVWLPGTEHGQGLISFARWHWNKKKSYKTADLFREPEQAAWVWRYGYTQSRDEKLIKLSSLMPIVKLHHKRIISGAITGPIAQ